MAGAFGRSPAALEFEVEVDALAQAAAGAEAPLASGPCYGVQASGKAVTSARARAGAPAVWVYRLT